MTTFDAFRTFKTFVADLEFTEDTIELDRRLGMAEHILYNCRREIDDEWLAARAKRRSARAVKSTRIIDLNDPEIAEIVANFIRSQQQ